MSSALKLFRAWAGGLLAGKSFTGAVAAWKRGDDMVDGARSRLDQPYAQSAWVRDAVHKVASPISGRPLKFYQGENEHADARLSEWWQAPARGPRVMGRETRLKLAQVLFDLAAWERLEGEFFLVLDESWLLTAARLSSTSRVLSSLPPFLIAHPQRMQIILQSGELAGWRYSDAAGKQYIFLPEQVIHHKSFNPYDDWRGVGGMQAAQVAAEGAFLTGAYIRDLARNNGDQGMVVIAKGGVVSDPQREQILTDLRAKRAALAHGVVKDMLLSGDIAVDRPKEQAASAELTTSQAMSHEEVFVAFGVPPSMAAVKQSYSIGKESDKYQLITDTCQPVGTAVACALGEVASRQTGLALTAELEWDDHPVMIEVRNSRLDAALKLWGVGMPMEEANDYLGLGMQPFDGWDVGYLPFSVAPVAADPNSDLPTPNSQDPAVDPALAEPADDADPDVEQLRLLVAVRQRMRCAKQAEVSSQKSEVRDPLAMFACTCGASSNSDLPSSISAALSPAELAHWRTLMGKRRETVANFKGAFGRVLMTARAEVLRKIESGQSKFGNQKSKIEKSAAADFLFDLAKFADGFLSVMRNQQRTALDTAGKQFFAEIGKDDPFKFPAEEVLNFLSGRENKLRDTPQAIHEEIKAALEEGLLKGETAQQLSGRVRGAFNGISQERALRIAMTETAAAYGAGRDEAMVQAGIKWKKWLTSGNANVRSAHAAANGQIVAIDEAFTVDGESLMFPGDDAGSPANVINCHCVSVSSATGPDA